MVGDDGGLGFFLTDVDLFTRERMEGDYGGGVMLRVH